jgi:hypothetical protein
MSQPAKAYLQGSYKWRRCYKSLKLAVAALLFGLRAFISMAAVPASTYFLDVRKLEGRKFISAHGHECKEE